MSNSKTTAAARAAAAAPVAADVPQSTLSSKVKIPCKLDVFFTYCRLAWSYCLQYRERLSAISPRFTEAFIAAQVASVGEVERLPTLQARKAEASTANIKLQAENQAVRSLLQKLKSYILYAFKDKAVADVQLRAAGLNNYSVQLNNWGNTAGMIRDAKRYLEQNTEKLMANDNMPSGFPRDFDDAAGLFSSAWTDFTNKEKAIVDGTGSQDAGVQQILEELNPMLAIGKRTFEFEPLLRKKFTTGNLLNEVRSKHQAGIRGTVTLSTSAKPKPGVRVSIEGDSEKSAITDAAGRYELNLAAGTYTLVFTSDDTLPYLVTDKKVKPGVKARLNASLEPLLMEEEGQADIVLPPTTSESLSSALLGSHKIGNGQEVAVA